MEPKDAQWIKAGRKLKRQRSELGMTQEELAKELELCHETIARFETGRRRISKPVELAVKYLLTRG